MPARYDVSRVPLQGGYVAKQCPVRAQNDAIVPGVPLPPTPFQERLFQGGNDFEAEIFAELTALHADLVVIDGHGDDAEAATRAAMDRRVTLILGGRLPADPAGRRLGKPDILVAAAAGGYRVVDVKHHQNLEPTKGTASEFPGRFAPLANPAFESAAVDDKVAAKKKEGDLLQLAHYQRMLETAGFAAANGRWAAIIGTERRVVWYDLDAPLKRTPSTSTNAKTRVRSTMERYDFEFDFRLDIIAVAEQHKADSAVELLVVPVKVPECESCPWWDYCRPQLETAPGDVSLLPRVGWTQWKAHRDHGVHNRAHLAALDPLTARLVAAGIDVVALMAAAAEMPAGIALDNLAGEKQLALLIGAGVVTAGDVLRLDAATAAYSDAGLTALPNHIDMARAALGSEPVYRRRGVTAIDVPRADVEVDIDMENTELGCYLWGTCTTDLSGLGVVDAGYRAFAAWQPMSPAIEAANSLRFWRWLTELRTDVNNRGLTFAAYCWNANAENAFLRALGLANAVIDDVEAFIASADWIDLLIVWDKHFITGHGSGLKAVAPLVGFQWEVDDPGGGESMLRYDSVAAGDDSAKAWLLSYNRGDVEATRSIREWMSATSVPGIEDWG